ncbi:MAG TPA: small multi-drug export protein [Candidatus Bipolaricaulota bacterium]|nr:small multi-drug export protein [Candidatus Bipolaricaulota bacterium]
MIQTIIDYFSNVEPRWATFWLSMIPFTELRAALPIALLGYKLPVWEAIVFSIAGNMIPAVIILFSLDWLSDFLAARINWYKKFQTWLFERTARKFEGKYRKYGRVALLIFVGIPLPLTGAWTGAIAAFIFGFKKKWALLFIFLGLIMSAIIVTLLSLGVISVM